ncbi:MAG: PAC2 family protein, partial [Candidatus Ranarchaeia archaeon]
MKEQTFFDLAPPKTQNNILLVGMPGIALVGKLAVKTIIDQYKAKKVLNLYLDDLPPRIIIDKTGKPSSLSMSLYYAQDADRKRGLLLLIGDIQPQSHVGQYDFADWVCKIAEKYNVNLILACAAAVTPLFKENPGVHIAGNSFPVVKSF